MDDAGKPFRFAPRAGLRRLQAVACGYAVRNLCVAEQSCSACHRTPLVSTFEISDLGSRVGSRRAHHTARHGNTYLPTDAASHRPGTQTHHARRRADHLTHGATIGPERGADTAGAQCDLWAWSPGRDSAQARSGDGCPGAARVVGVLLACRWGQPGRPAARPLPGCRCVGNAATRRIGGVIRPLYFRNPGAALRVTRPRPGDAGLGARSRPWAQAAWSD